MWLHSSSMHSNVSLRSKGIPICSFKTSPLKLIIPILILFHVTSTPTKYPESVFSPYKIG